MHMLIARLTIDVSAVHWDVAAWHFDAAPVYLDVSALYLLPAAGHILPAAVYKAVTCHAMLHLRRDASRMRQLPLLCLLFAPHAQPHGQRGQQEDCAEHVHQEHEGQQDAHVGLELDRKSVV